MLSETRVEKVGKIFRRFDANEDGGLNRSEMAALVIAVNPRVNFSENQMDAILEEVFRSYSEFIDEQKGLSLAGLLRTYDDGAGDIDRDFEALALQNSGEAEDSAPDSDPINHRHVAPPPASITRSRTHSYELTCIVEKLKSTLDNRVTQKESASGSLTRVQGELLFHREISDIRQRADASPTPEEAFDAHMAIGRILFDHGLFKECLVSFRRATELKPTDARPHFRYGNALYFVHRYSEAKEAYTLALDAAEISGNQSSSLIPQFHVNLGIALEAEGMLLSASEHYKEAAIREPRHYRAMKLLGSALYGVGEYRAAEKALKEAIYLKPDYADAHCDLGSTLHALGEDEMAIEVFQKAIDLKPDHLDALYNLGGLFKDIGRHQNAAEMYSKVLAVQSDHWRAQLNKGVALLGAGDIEAAQKSFKEAFKMTNRMELYDAFVHLKHMDKKPKGLLSFIRKAEENPGTSVDISFREEQVTIVEASRFRQATAKTTPRQWLSYALDIRAFQKQSQFNGCDVASIKKELTGGRLPISSSGGAVAEKSIRKEELEKVLRRLLQSLKPEMFQMAVKAINERILRSLDGAGSGRIDLGMFFALISPICSGPLDKRKRAAFDSLVWRSSKNIGAEISRADASRYISLLHTIYLSSQETSGIIEVLGDEDQANISFPEFVELFDEPDWGFGILSVLAKLETSDRVRHGGHTCAVCSYPIVGPRFKEVTSNFSLCSLCYSEGKVPINIKQQEYCFKEYDSEAEAVRERIRIFNCRLATP